MKPLYLKVRSASGVVEFLINEYCGQKINFLPCGMRDVPTDKFLVCVFKNENNTENARVIRNDIELGLVRDSGRKKEHLYLDKEWVNEYLL